MIRCANCRTIQADGATTCLACGAALGAESTAAGSAESGPAVTPPALPTSGGPDAPTPAIPSRPDAVLEGQPVMAPPPSRTGLLLAVVGSSVTLVVLLVALVVVITRPAGDGLTTSAEPPGSSGSAVTSTSVAPSSAPSTTASSGNASVSLTADSATVTTPAAITVRVAFVGDPGQVESSTLLLGGLPSPDSGPGLRNQFTVPTSFPGPVDLKVEITLKDGRSIQSNAVAVTVAAPTTLPPPTTPAPPAPVLGQVWAPYQEGYGTVRPSLVFNGGVSTGSVDHVVWDSWGGERATGKGTGYYAGPNQMTAEATAEPATLVAFNLGTCKGKRAYLALAWYFPGKGQRFNPNQYINICTGDYVG